MTHENKKLWYKTVHQNANVVYVQLTIICHQTTFDSAMEITEHLKYRFGFTNNFLKEIELHVLPIVYLLPLISIFSWKLLSVTFRLPLYCLENIMGLYVSSVSFQVLKNNRMS